MNVVNKDKLKKVGNASQLYSVEKYRLCEGKADDMRMISMRNGKGLSAVIAADRCMDIYRLDYKGVNLGYISPAGMVASKYYQPEEFLRSFSAGFLTTCGLRNIGAGCVYEGENAVVHGRIGNTPADRVFCDVSEDENPVLVAGGTMTEAVLFGEKLELRRRLTMQTESNTLTINDTVTNIGGEAQPLTILYHMNMGYPLLDSFSEIHIPAKKTSPRDERAAEGIDDWASFAEPQSGFAEQCYYHTLASKNDRSSVMLYNPELNFGVMISMNTKTLDFFTEWKMPGVKDYVLGLEPGNAHVEGCEKMRSQGILKYIQPLENVNFEVEIKIIDGNGEYKTAKENIAALL